MDAIPKNVRIILTALLVICLAEAAPGQTVCCSKCGSTDGIRRTCRPVRTTRPVETDWWDVVEGDVAVPLAHGLLACNCRSGGDCCTSGKCGLCLTGGCQACCKVRPRNRLMRKTLLEEIPIVVWVVDYVCTDCAAHGGPGSVVQITDTPPPAAEPIGNASPMQELVGQSPAPASPSLPTRSPEAAGLDELMRTLNANVPAE